MSSVPSDWQRLRGRFATQSESQATHGERHITFATPSAYNESLLKMNESSPAMDAWSARILKQTEETDSTPSSNEILDRWRDRSYATQLASKPRYDQVHDPLLETEVQGVLNQLRNTKLRVESDRIDLTDDEDDDGEEKFRQTLLTRRHKVEQQTKDQDLSGWARKISHKYDSYSQHNYSKQQVSEFQNPSHESNRLHTQMHYKEKCTLVRDHVHDRDHSAKVRLCLQKESEENRAISSNAFFSSNGSTRHHNENMKILASEFQRISIRNLESKTPSIQTKPSLFQWDVERFPRVHEEERRKQDEILANESKTQNFSNERMEHRFSRSASGYLAEGANSETYNEQKQSSFRLAHRGLVLSRKQQSELLRMEARRELRTLRNVFERLFLYSEKRRTRREEAHAFALCKFRLQHRTRLLRKCFHALAEHACRVSSFRVRTVQHRAFERWTLYTANQHEQKMIAKLDLIRREQRQILCQQAMIHFQARILKKYWSEWVKDIKQKKVQREEEEKQAIRQRQIQRFKVHLRQCSAETNQDGNVVEDISSRSHWARTSGENASVVLSKEKQNHQQPPGEQGSSFEPPPPSSNPPPLPNKAPVAARELTAMELRAVERKAKREELRRRQAELEQMRAEEASQRSYEEHLRIVQERAQDLAKKRQLQAKREYEKQVRENRDKLSTLHNERAILWYKGLKPWKLLVRIAKLDDERARAHDRRSKLRQAFVYWSGVIRSIQLVRRQKQRAMENAARHFRRRSLLRLGWRLIAERHYRLQAQFAAIESSNRICMLKQACKTWQRALLRHIQEMMQADLLANYKLLTKMWRFWLQHVERRREERRRVVGKNQIWSKVRTWLEEEEEDI